jgi:hypothetical protein
LIDRLVDDYNWLEIPKCLHRWCSYYVCSTFNRRGVQMIISVYIFISNVNKSSVNVFITTMKSIVAEASTCTIKYCNEAFVFYMFLTLDIGW